MTNKCSFIIDVREKDFGVKVANDLVTKYKRNADNISIEEMGTGDYKVISPDGTIVFTIERKTAKDFRASFTDGRLERQPIELGKEQNPILVITGNIFVQSLWKGTTMKVPDSITKLLNSLCIKRPEGANKLQILQLPFDSQIVVLLDHIAKKIENNELILEVFETGKKERKMKIDKKSEEYHDIVLYDVFRRVPRMPKIVAKKLVIACDYDFSNFMRKSPNDLMNLKIKGFGIVLIKRTYETFHRKIYTN